MTRTQRWVAAAALLATLYCCAVAALHAAPQRPPRADPDDPPERLAGLYGPSPAPVLTVDEVGPGGRPVRVTYYLVFRTRAQEALLTASLHNNQPLMVTGHRGVNGPWHHIVVLSVEEP